MGKLDGHGYLNPPPPPVIRHEGDFVALHGGEFLDGNKGLKRKPNGQPDMTRHFPDGATMVADMHAVATGRGEGWTFFDPPSDPVLNLKARRAYWERKVAYLTTSFTELRNILLGVAGTQRWDPMHFGSPMAEYPPDRLRQIRSALLRARIRLGDVEREVDSLPPHKRDLTLPESVRARRDFGSGDAINREHHRRFTDEVESIGIDGDPAFVSE